MGGGISSTKKNIEYFESIENTGNVIYLVKASQKTQQSLSEKSISCATPHNSIRPESNRKCTISSNYDYEDSDIITSDNTKIDQEYEFCACLLNKTNSNTNSICDYEYEGQQFHSTISPKSAACSEFFNCEENDLSTLLKFSKNYCDSNNFIHLCTLCDKEFESKIKFDEHVKYSKIHHIAALKQEFVTLKNTEL